MTKAITFFLAGGGLVLAIWSVLTADRGPASIPPDRPPTESPYQQSINAVGIVEAASRNIQLACAEMGVVEKVFVEVNEQVRLGDPILQLDTAVLEAEYKRAKVSAQLAQQRLEKLQALPRPQDVAPYRAVVDRFKVELAHNERELERLKKLETGRAVSEAQVATQAHAVDLAQENLQEAVAELDRIQAGAWERDVKIAEHQLEEALALAEIVHKRLERHTLRAPIDGVILKRMVEPGEFVSPEKGPAAVIGDISTLRVRAQVDEADSPLLRQGVAAVASLRGLPHQAIQLKMLHIEPLALPKQNLTHSDMELVDTRVVEVLFAVDFTDGPSLQLYPGQLLDVYVQASSPKQVGHGRVTHDLGQ